MVYLSGRNPYKALQFMQYKMNNDCTEKKYYKMIRPTLNDADNTINP